MTFNPLSLLSSAGSAVTDFLSGFQGYLIAGGLALAVGAAGGAWAGYRIEASKVAAIQLADARSHAQAVQHGADVQKAADAVDLAAAVKEAQAQAQIVTVTKTLTVEVPKYVTLKADTVSCIPVGLARVLRAAAAGVDPSALNLAPGQSDDACSDVTASEVAGWFKDYASASEGNAEQLNALEDDINTEHAAVENTK